MNPPLTQPPAPVVQLIRSPSYSTGMTEPRAGDRRQWFPPTADLSVDSHKALTRGLADYLSDKTIVVGGKIFQFKKCFFEVADPSDKTNYPALSVQGGGESQEEPSGLTSSIAQLPLASGSRVHLVKYGELTEQLTMEIWASTPAERSALMLLLERELHPVTWMSGFRLYLPFYCGRIARYDVTKPRYEDMASSVQQGQRKAMVTLVGSLPLVQLREFVPGRPRVVSEVKTSGQA